MRLYRAALRAYPPDFRARFGDELTSAFVETMAERRRGTAWRIVARALADLARHAAGERLATWRGLPGGLGPVDRPRVPRAARQAGAARAGRLDALRLDLRHAVRTLRRRPGPSLVIVLTLALAFGASTTIFAVVHGVLLRPLAFPESARVLALCEVNARTADFCVASAMNVADWTARVPSLDAAGVARGESFRIRLDGRTVGLRGAVASPGFFAALSARPMIGRLLEDADLAAGARDVVVVSHAFWQHRLGARPDALDVPLQIDGRAMRVVGVLAADQFVPFLGDVDVWKPLTASIDDVTQRDWRGFRAIGRRAVDATPARLDADLEVARAALAAAYPDANDGWRIRAVPLRDQVVGPAGRTLWLFQGAVALLVIVAGANVTSLLLAGASARRREFALRVCLGAGRMQVVRQWLIEVLVLATVGGAGGWWLARSLTRGLMALAPASLPRLDEIRLDGTVALFGLGLTLAAAIVLGLIPALAAWRGRGASIDHPSRVTIGRSRLRSGLVIVEVALAFVLLVGASLLTRTFARLLEWSPGFDRDATTVTWAVAPPDVYETGARAVGALEALRDRLRHTPGVLDVGLVSAGPLFGGVETGMAIPGTAAAPADGSGILAAWYDVDERGLDVMGRRLLAGRGFEASDADGATPVAIVNETFARRVFGDPSPVGRQVTVQEHASEIVGVIGDVRPLQPGAQPAPEIYWPIRQYRRFAAYLLVRATPGTAGLDRAIRDAAETEGSAVQLGTPQTYAELRDRALVSPRFNAALIGLFASSALLVAALGVYGIVARTVSEGTREIAVRVALGATRGRVLAAVARRGLVLAVGGLSAGLAGAIALGPLFAHLLYGLPPRDPGTLAAATALFAGVAAIACYLPAKRAGRVDPIEALREQPTAGNRRRSGSWSIAACGCADWTELS
ncbi:MAG: ABC transporter permease [Vicinamibacterales bacterium]